MNDAVLIRSVVLNELLTDALPIVSIRKVRYHDELTVRVGSLADSFGELPDYWFTVADKHVMLTFAKSLKNHGVTEICFNFYPSLSTIRFYGFAKIVDKINQ